VYDEKQISIHKAICCNSEALVDFYRAVYPVDELFRMLMLRDNNSFNCFDYANLCQSKYIKQAIHDVQQKAYLTEKPV